MDYQEILKLFGTPLSEVAKPKTIGHIKFEYFCIGIFTATALGAIWINKTKNRNISNWRDRMLA